MQGAQDLQESQSERHALQQRLADAEAECAAVQQRLQDAEADHAHLRHQADQAMEDLLDTQLHASAADRPQVSALPQPFTALLENGKEACRSSGHGFAVVLQCSCHNGSWLVHTQRPSSPDKCVAGHCVGSLWPESGCCCPLSF